VLRWGSALARARITGRERRLAAVELQDVVSGGHQMPFRAAGGSPTTHEAIEPPVELHLRKDRLDRRLAFSVVLGDGHPSHQR
jgi:hypothetical protein